MRRGAAAPGRPRTGRRVLLAALALASTVLGAAVATAPAQAAGPKYPRVRPVVASADYLVYRQQTANAHGLFFPAGSTLYVVGKHGGRHVLSGFDPERTQSLQGSTLVEGAGTGAPFDPTSSEQLRWRDLRTGRSGTFALPVSERLAGAVPGGWITMRTEDGSTHLTRYTTAGRATDLGTPLPGEGPANVAIGPKGVIATAGRVDSDQVDERAGLSGRIRYRAFRAAGTWHTVYAAGAGVAAGCDHPSTTHVLCSVDHAGRRSGAVLLSLDGHRRTWLTDHPKACPVLSLTTVGRSAVGKATSTQAHCVRGRLTQLDADGGVTTPKRDWGAHSSYITAGLGGILLDTKDQRRIVLLSSVTGTGRTIATAR